MIQQLILPLILQKQLGNVGKNCEGSRHKVNFDQRQIIMIIAIVAHYY